MIGRAKKRGKAGGRIEPRPTQPVNRTIAAHQSRCLAVADQRIVFNRQRHWLRLTWKEARSSASQTPRRSIINPHQVQSMRRGDLTASRAVARRERCCEVVAAPFAFADMH